MKLMFYVSLNYDSGVYPTSTARVETNTSSGVRDLKTRASAFPLRIVAISLLFKPTNFRKKRSGSGVSCQVLGT